MNGLPTDKRIFPISLFILLLQVHAPSLQEMRISRVTSYQIWFPWMEESIETYGVFLVFAFIYQFTSRAHPWRPEDTPCKKQFYKEPFTQAHKSQAMLWRSQVLLFSALGWHHSFQFLTQTQNLPFYFSLSHTHLLHFHFTKEVWCCLFSSSWNMLISLSEKEN